MGNFCQRRKLQPDIFNQVLQDSNQKYSKEFTESKYISYITDKMKAMGLPLIYDSLVLFYLMKNPSQINYQQKIIIIACLGYLISPIDIILDCIPVFGFLDDVYIIKSAVKLLKGYITQDIQQQAKDFILKYFKEDYEPEQEDETYLTSLLKKIWFFKNMNAARQINTAKQINQ